MKFAEDYSSGCGSLGATVTHFMSFCNVGAVVFAGKTSTDFNFLHGI